MSRKDMSRKEHLIVEHLPKKRRRTLEETIGTTTTFYHLSIYNPLSRNFNNITRWLNLTDVNLSNNNIVDLPMEFGTLPSIRELNLSRNHINIFYRNGWLKEAAIRNTLVYLNLSNNLITKLPHYFWELNALVMLIVSCNMLRSLPQGIENMRRLKILVLSNNLLKHLPHRMLSMQALLIVDISWNPCLTQSYILQCDRLNLSLVKLSAIILRKHRIEYKSILPNILTKYVDTIKYCDRCNVQNFKVDYKYRESYYPETTVLMIMPSSQFYLKLIIKSYRCYFCSKLREHTIHMG